MQLDNLNPQQYQAVTTVQGAVLVLSGAGTGKTRVLTMRIAHILQQGLCKPWEILAVTFTNKAAREMLDRVNGALGEKIRSNWIGTFHRMGMLWMSRHAEDIGYEKNFIITDEDDQKKLIRKLMQEMDIDTQSFSPAVIADGINRLKDKGLLPQDTTRYDYTDPATEQVFPAYQKRMKQMNAVDFADLLLLPLRMFTEKPEIAQIYQQQYRYIMVDEYQDTNSVQYQLLKVLAKNSGNLCCVGDDDQSIYSWRGADISNILQFEKDFPDAQIIRLESNYRSTAPILNIASKLIANNSERLGKTLRVAEGRDGAGDRVTVKQLFNGEEEARFIARQAKEEHIVNQIPYSDMAVLVRAGWQSREIEDIFLKSGLRYRIVGNASFYDRMEIRDAVAYLRLAANTGDDFAFERVINIPRRGIGETTLKRLRAVASATGRSLFASCGELGNPKINEFTAMINGFSALKDQMPPHSLLTDMLEKTGYMNMWLIDKTEIGRGRVENLREMISTIASDFTSLEEYLEHVALYASSEERTSDGIDDGGQISLMTMHAAKGLEFAVVFLAGWEEGVFPNSRALDDGGLGALEEERRLAYVGITRAKRKLYITLTSMRRVFGQTQTSVPSRFIKELT